MFLQLREVSIRLSAEANFTAGMKPYPGCRHGHAASRTQRVDWSEVEDGFKNWWRIERSRATIIWKIIPIRLIALLRSMGQMSHQ